MKKHITTLCYGLCILLIGASCQSSDQPRTYHIQGYIPDAPDGTVVRLQVDQEQNLKTLLETTIDQEHFIFTGRQDSTIECTVTYRLGGITQGATFFLENGDISMNLGQETSRITGTTHNRHYQGFLDKINGLYAKIGTIYNETPADSLDEHEQELRVRQLIKPLQQQVNALIFETAKANNDNALGYYLLRRFQQELTASQQKLLINNLPAQLRRTSAIEDILNQLAILPEDAQEEDNYSHSDEDFDL